MMYVLVSDNPFIGLLFLGNQALDLAAEKCNHSKLKSITSLTLFIKNLQ